MSVAVLRLGHRLGRDARISTHCGLVARAFSAQEIIYTGDRDEKLLESVNRVAEKWGGPFSASYSDSWKSIINKYRKNGFAIVHLSVYGLPIQKVIRKIRKMQNILIIIGGEKVPPQVYHEADFNIAVTSQPHSEVAALAVFLHEYFKGKELERKFRGAKLRIVPQEKGKRVLKL